MATRYWLGGAAPIAQVQDYLFAGTWLVGETITVAIGNKSVTFTIASATIATFLDTLVDAYNALSRTVYPEIAEQTASFDTATFSLTADTAGKPFVCTISTNSASGTIDGGASSTGTGNPVSSGPEDVSTAANWSAATVPVTGDTVIVDREGARLKYNLDQSGVVAAVRRITARDVEIGLPPINKDGTEYSEYRDTYWRMTATLDYVNTESGRIKLDHGTGQTSYEQDGSGTGRDRGVPAVLLKGTHASNTWNIFGGNAGLAWYGGDTAVYNVLNVQARTTVKLGIGCTGNTINNYGGALTVNAAISTALNHPSAAGGTTTIEGTGAVAQITAQSGIINYNTTGTLGGNTELGGNAHLTMDGDQRAKVVTNPIKIYSPQARFSDKNGVITGGYTLEFHNCVGSLVLRPDSQVVVSAL